MDAVDARFHFRPGVDPATWPAIDEPSDSLTIDLAPIFARENHGFAADEDAVNDLVLEALIETFPSDCRLVALDWQHPTYWFWPHRQAALDEEWRVPAFANGDYHILVTEDLNQGTFGHPWEQTLCVFGNDLVKAVVPLLSARGFQSSDQGRRRKRTLLPRRVPNAQDAYSRASAHDRVS